MHWKFFSPRLGVAYRVTDKTVLRAGVWYFLSAQHVLSQDGPNLSPVNNAPTFYTPANAPGLSVSNPYPTSVGLNQPLRRNATPGDFYGQGIFVMRVPGDKWHMCSSGTLQSNGKSASSASLTVAYAGSRGNPSANAGLGHCFEYWTESVGQTNISHSVRVPVRGS